MRNERIAQRAARAVYGSIVALAVIVVIEEAHGEADAVITTDEAVFHQLASGQQNAFAALLRGAVGAEGRVQLLAQFPRLLPAPPKSRRARRTGGSTRSRT